MKHTYQRIDSKDNENLLILLMQQDKPGATPSWWVDSGFHPSENGYPELKYKTILI